VLFHTLLPAIVLESILVSMVSRTGNNPVYACGEDVHAGPGQLFQARHSTIPTVAPVRAGLPIILLA